MDDMFSKIKRLHKKRKRESVELDLISLLIEFHTRTPVNRIECDLRVQWVTGMWRLSLIRVEYKW